MSSSFKRRLVHLHACKGVTYRLLKRVLQLDPTLKQLYAHSASQLAKQLDLQPANARALWHDLHNCQLKQIMTTYTRRGIVPLTVADAAYPYLLKQIFDPPPVLYAKGKLSLLAEPCLAVVGTRKPTVIGKKKY